MDNDTLARIAAKQQKKEEPETRRVDPELVAKSAELRAQVIVIENKLRTIPIKPFQVKIENSDRGLTWTGKVFLTQTNKDRHERLDAADLAYVVDNIDTILAEVEKGLE